MVERLITSIYRESALALTVSLGGGIVAGTILGTEMMVESFEAYPGLLLLLPAFLAMKGNVYGAMGARLTTGLHQGLIEPRVAYDRRLRNLLVATFINSMVVSIFIGGLSWGILQLLNRESATLLELVGSVAIAGVLTWCVLVVGTTTLLFAGYRIGLDPDNLMGPIVTTLGDVFGITFLYVAFLLVGVLL